MMGWEPLVKLAPAMGIICTLLVGYGSLKSDIENIKATQIRQYDQIQDQLKIINQYLLEKK